LAKGAHVSDKLAGGARVGYGWNDQRRESDMSESKGQLDPNRLTIEQASKLLSAATKVRIPEELIVKDIEEGAPQNNDGTISLVHYAAWIVKEMGRGE